MNLKLSPGLTRSEKPITWHNADNPHLNISGQSGTGKSFLMKKLAAQAAEQGAFVLALDYTSDFADYTPPDNLNYQRVDVTSPDFQLNPLVGSPGQSPNIRAQQLLAALHSVFRMGTAANLLIQNATTAYLAKAESPTLDGLLNSLYQMDNPSRGIQTAMENIAFLAMLVHCGTQQISLDLGTPGLTVLDYSQIIDRDQCKLLIELVLQTLWTAHTQQHPPLILILDEAQQLHWGAGSMSMRILREGRKFDIAGWFSSQWCDKKEAASALGQAARQIYFRPDGQHVAKLAKAICSRPTDISQCRETLQRLPRGEFIWQKADGRPIVIKVTP